MIENYDGNKKEILLDKIIKFKNILDRPTLSKYRYLIYSLDTIETRLLGNCFIDFNTINGYIDGYNRQILKELN